MFTCVKQGDTGVHFWLAVAQTMSRMIGMSKRGEAGNETEKSSGWRGSREVWLAAAKRTLLDAGVDAVKIQPLATRLNISRTSFYWFFKDRDELLEILLGDWEAKNTGAFVEACAAYSETVSEAVLNLIAVFYDEAVFEPRLDMAVRGWAHRSQAVAARVNASDERRLASIRQMFERFGYSTSEADVRARTVYLVQIGYIAMQVQETVTTRLSRVPGYVEVYSGRSATPGEMARFRARIAHLIA